MDLPSFQRRYLYAQSFGAAHTASSLLKNLQSAAWGHAAYRNSSGTNVLCRPGALTGRLFQQAARGYWLLREAEQYNDCFVLARNLLERIFNSRVASKSPKHAIELIAHELSKRIRGLRLLQREHQRLPKEATETIGRLDSELKVFLSMLGTKPVPRWDYYRRASEL